MNIVFRLNYSTVPGQSLWLKYSTVLDENGVRFDQIVPLRWLNSGQWEASIIVSGVPPHQEMARSPQVRSEPRTTADAMTPRKRR